MKRLILLLSIALLPLMTQAQNKISVDVHNMVRENETFAVIFSIDTDKQCDDFTWTPEDGVQLLYGPATGYSSSTTIINNKTTTTSRRTFTYTVHAVSAGKYTIPAARAKVGGQTIYSSPVTIEIVPASSSKSQSSTSSSQNKTSQDQDESNALLLKARVDRSKVVVGEPITITFKLLSKISVRTIDGFYPPSFKDFNAQEIPLSNNSTFTRELYDGEIFEVVDIGKYRLYPLRQGQLSISPAELICMIRSRRGLYNVRVKSEELIIDVSDLPAGAPETFGQGIGSFKMSARLSSDVMKAHEAGTLFITVSGTGNVDALEAPQVTFHPDMEVYDVKSEDKFSNGGLSGSKTFEYPFIPRSIGNYVIGPIEYTYYDVNTAKYVTLTVPEMPLTVEKGTDINTAGPTMVVGAHRKEVANLGTDIRFINLDRPDFSKKGDFYIKSLGYWIFTILILLAGIVTWLVLRKMLARRADIVGMKRRKATKMAFKRLSLAESFLKQNSYSAFYEELHKALLGYVANKLNMPISDLSRDRIAEVLSQRNVPSEQIEQFVGLIDACEFARYAPETESGAMLAHYETALDVISSIDSNIKTKHKMKSVYVLIMLMLLPFASYAHSGADGLWQEANNAYLEGKWEDAALGYEKISQMGLESASLYCNLGDAYFKANYIAKAILNYERALKLDPSYEDARHNLELCNTMVQDKIESVPEFFLTRWFRGLSHIFSSDTWAILFLVFLTFTIVLILLFFFARTATGRILGFSAGIITLIISIASLSFSIWQKNEYASKENAIVMSSVVSAKGSPSEDSSQELFLLHEGTKVKVLDRVGTWNNIELNDGRQGWVPSSDIETI